jgi:hypothetical protein
MQQINNLWDFIELVLHLLGNKVSLKEKDIRGSFGNA